MPSGLVSLLIKIPNTGALDLIISVMDDLSRMWTDIMSSIVRSMEPKCSGQDLLAFIYQIGKLPFTMIFLESFNESFALSPPSTLDIEPFVGCK